MKIPFRFSVLAITEVKFHPFAVSVKLWAAFFEGHLFGITPKRELGGGGWWESKNITEICEKSLRKIWIFQIFQKSIENHFRDIQNDQSGLSTSKTAFIFHKTLVFITFLTMWKSENFRKITWNKPFGKGSGTNLGLHEFTCNWFSVLGYHRLNRAIWLERKSALKL